MCRRKLHTAFFCIAGYISDCEVLNGCRYQCIETCPGRDCILLCVGPVEWLKAEKILYTMSEEDVSIKLNC